MAGRLTPNMPRRGQLSPLVWAAWSRLPPIERLWDSMRRLRVFTVAALAAAARTDKRTARSYVERLVAGGYASQEPDMVPAAYALTRDAGVRPPRIGLDGEKVSMGSARQKAWSIMKVLRQFTPRDLHVDCGIAEGEAKFYCRFLVRAGYLRLIEESSPRRQAKYQWIPSRYTGPRAPQVTRLDVVWDPNTMEVMWPRETGETQA